MNRNTFLSMATKRELIKEIGDEKTAKKVLGELHPPRNIGLCYLPGFVEFFYLLNGFICIRFTPGEV